MFVFETVNSLVGGNLGAAVDIYYKLIDIIGKFTADYVRNNFQCTGCIIEHGSQHQHECLMFSSAEKVDSLFVEAYTNLNEEDILNEWYRQLTEEEDFDVLYLPHQWKEDIHFLNDIWSSAIQQHDPETD